MGENPNFWVQTSHRLSSLGNQSCERLSTETNVEKDYCISHSNYG